MGLRQGLGYMFWFSLGFAFERRRRLYVSWPSRKLCAVLAVLVMAEALSVKFSLRPKFFTVLCGCSMTYIFAVLCARMFRGVSETGAWRVLVRNLFAVYLFHDPLEYLVLRGFMTSKGLASWSGCAGYLLSRSVVVFAASVMLGELAALVRGFLGYD